MNALMENVFSCFEETLKMWTNEINLEYLIIFQFFLVLVKKKKNLLLQDPVQSGNDRNSQYL